LCASDQTSTSTHPSFTSFYKSFFRQLLQVFLPPASTSLSSASFYKSFFRRLLQIFLPPASTSLSSAGFYKSFFRQLLQVFLPPRSGALNLAVGFNPRDGRGNNLFVASATVESATTSESQGEIQPSLTRREKNSSTPRGLKPTAEFRRRYAGGEMSCGLV
jgi:hypothetical protein